MHEISVPCSFPTRDAPLPALSSPPSRTAPLWLPSPTPTHLAVDLPSPPALLPLLVKDLDNVALFEGQLWSVPGAEVIAGFGRAKVFGAPGCTAETWEIAPIRALQPTHHLRRTMLSGKCTGIKDPSVLLVFWGNTAVFPESFFQPNQRANLKDNTIYDLLNVLCLFMLSLWLRW